MSTFSPYLAADALAQTPEVYSALILPNLTPSQVAEVAAVCEERATALAVESVAKALVSGVSSEEGTLFARDLLALAIDVRDLVRHNDATGNRAVRLVLPTGEALKVVLVPAPAKK